jgi:hypothetical protein
LLYVNVLLFWRGWLLSLKKYLVFAEPLFQLISMTNFATWEVIYHWQPFEVACSKNNCCVVWFWTGVNING